MHSTWTPQYGHLAADRPQWAAQKPIRIALLGDFSASSGQQRLDTGAELAARKPIPVDFDTLEDALARLDVNVHLHIDGDHHTSLAITELESFHPDELYRESPLFAELLALRKALNHPSTFDKAAAKVLRWSDSAQRKASRTNRRKRALGSAVAPDAKLSDFARLVGADHDTLHAAPEQAADALIARIMAPFVVPAAKPEKAALLSAVDAALSDAMRTLLHHPDFQTTEALWRGVDWLLRRLESSHQLQVHLIDINAQEFAADLSSVDDLSDSGLYQLLVQRPSQEKNGGYTFIAGLYQFEATPPHTELLGRMAQIAQHANASFLSAMAVQDLSDPKKPAHPLVSEALQQLKALPASTHLALFGPQFMLRHPYGQRTDPISSFTFEEFSPQTGLASMLWGHPALAALCALAGNSNAIVDDLPFHHFKDAHGDTIALPCTDKLILRPQASALHQHGICALMAHKGAPALQLSSLTHVDGSPLQVTQRAPDKQRAQLSTSVGLAHSLQSSAPSKGNKPSPSSAAGRSTASDDSDDNLGLDSSDSDDFDSLFSSLDSSDDSDSLSLDTEDSSSSDDLDALLSQWSDDNSSADTDTPDDDSDDDMDADFAALLASLDA